MKLPENLDGWIKTLSTLGAALAFAWGVFQFVTAQHAQAETRRIEATKPFLDLQLKLYTEATKVVATIATSTVATDVDVATKRFWALYWGEMSLVEDAKVESAMVAVSMALNQGKTGSELGQQSLSLAHAIRDSLANSWGVEQWRNPHGPQESKTH
jgi:hypothetical protein